MGRDGRKESSQVGKWQVSWVKGTCIQGLPWAVMKWLDLSTHLPNLKSLYESLNWVQSRIPSRWSHPHIIISRLCPWSSLWEWRKQGESTFQGQGRGWGASNCPRATNGSTSDHIFSSQWFSPTDVTFDLDKGNHYYPPFVFISLSHLEMLWNSEVVLLLKSQWVPINLILAIYIYKKCKKKEVISGKNELVTYSRVKWQVSAFIHNGEDTLLFHNLMTKLNEFNNK